ncbi:hypothetical protein B0H13DRAFT_1919158 [Mycena leptocephala]|nr:hypothetical protein B0H13DRAFT_1919158 [Mycena leptocephala]
MSSHGDETAELLQLIADSRVTGYLAVASLCVLIYDHIVCFPQEVDPLYILVQFTNPDRWNSCGAAAGALIVYVRLLSPLFSQKAESDDFQLWNRYFSLIAISVNTSVIVREIESETACVFYLSHIAELIAGQMHRLVKGSGHNVDFGHRDCGLRPHAHRSVDHDRIRTLGVCTAIPENIFMILPSPILKGCYAYNVPRFLTTYAAAPLLVTFIMFAMTVYKCGTTLQRYEAGVMQMWKLFLRDGVLWFLAVFAAAGAALLIWTMQRETLKQLLVVPALVVYSTVASRTLLNIKALVAEGGYVRGRIEYRERRSRTGRSHCFCVG